MSKRKKTVLIIICVIISAIFIALAVYLMKPIPISQELRKLDNSKVTVVTDEKSDLPFQFVSETAKIGNGEYCVYASVAKGDGIIDDRTELAIYKNSGVLNNKYDLCTSSTVFTEYIAKNYEDVGWLCWDVRKGNENLEYLRAGIEVLKLIDFRDGELIVNDDEEMFEDQREYLGSVYCDTVPADCVSVTINGNEAQIQNVKFEMDGKQIEFNIYYLIIEESCPDDIEIIGVDKNGNSHQITESQSDETAVTKIN